MGKREALAKEAEVNERLEHMEQLETRMRQFEDIDTRMKAMHTKIAKADAIHSQVHALYQRGLLVEDDEGNVQLASGGDK